MRHVLVSSLVLASAIMLSPPSASSQSRAVGLTIFADPNFRGRSATLRDDTPDFRTIGMNDVTSSLQVAPGEQWEVCEHINHGGRCIIVTGGGTWDLCDRANFGGRCVAVVGNVPDLASIGLAGRVASVRITRSTR